MKSVETKSNKLSKHIVSIAFSVTVMLVSWKVIGLFMLFFDYSKLSYSIRIIVYSIIVMSLIVIPCYFICRQNYRSVWYVPIVANFGTLMITSEGFLANYWSFNARISLLLVTVLLSVFLSILGSGKGKLTSIDNIK